MTERSKYLFSHLASLPASLALDFLLLLYSTQLCWKDILLITLSHISNVILDLELFWLSVSLNFQSWPIFSPSASRCFLWSHDLLHRSKRDPASRCLHPPDQPHFSRGSDSKEILKSGGEKYIQQMQLAIYEKYCMNWKMDPASSCLPSRRKCFYWSLANFRDKSVKL